MKKSISCVSALACALICVASCTPGANTSAASAAIRSPAVTPQPGRAAGFGGTDALTELDEALAAKGLSPRHPARLFAERYRYYREKIDGGSYYLGFKPGTISLPYDMGVFLKSLEPGFLAKVRENAAAGKDLYAGMSGFLERPYLSESDGELDSYLVYVPTSYDPKKPAPILIFLHGNGGGAYQSPLMPSYHALLNACEERGVILVAPNGKNLGGAANSVYEGAGERDVLQVLELTRKAYRVDDRRIYLCGHSMGGHGALWIGSRNAKRFAAVASLAGYGTGIYGTAWSTPVNPEAFKDTAVFLYHGDADTVVPVEESRSMDEKLRNLGIRHEYRELPGVTHNGISAALDRDFLDALLSERR